MAPARCRVIRESLCTACCTKPMLHSRVSLGPPDLLRARPAGRARLARHIYLLRSQLAMRLRHNCGIDWFAQVSAPYLWTISPSARPRLSQMLALWPCKRLQLLLPIAQRAKGPPCVGRKVQLTWRVALAHATLQPPRSRRVEPSWLTSEHDVSTHKCKPAMAFTGRQARRCGLQLQWA